MAVPRTRMHPSPQTSRRSVPTNQCASAPPQRTRAHQLPVWNEAEMNVKRSIRCISARAVFSGTHQATQRASVSCGAQGEQGDGRRKQPL